MIIYSSEKLFFKANNYRKNEIFLEKADSSLSKYLFDLMVVTDNHGVTSKITIILNDNLSSYVRRWSITHACLLFLVLSVHAKYPWWLTCIGIGPCVIIDIYFLAPWAMHLHSLCNCKISLFKS